MFRGTIKERMIAESIGGEGNKKEFVFSVIKLLLWTGAITMLFAHVAIVETTFFLMNLPFMLIAFAWFVTVFCAFGSEEIESKLALKSQDVFSDEEIIKLKKFRKGVVRLMIMTKFVMPSIILTIGVIMNPSFYGYEIAGYTIGHWAFMIFLLSSLVMFVQCLLLNQSIEEGKEESELPRVLFADDLRKETMKINRVIEHRNEFFPEADFTEMKKEIESLNELLSVYKNADELVRFETKAVTKEAIEAVYNKLMQNTEASEEIELIERKAKRIVG